MGIAYEFDPYFALSVSRVDPLPHQLEAVYDYLLKLPSVRFLLADDAGAGKTIMAGLLIRELKLRGLVERVAVVCPANLTFQWQRELKEKFDETFFILKGSDIRNQFGANEWQERNQVITSLDLAKRADILPGLQQVRWDLVIVDEAHRMSARDESHKSQRYQLGEILRDSSDHILLLTATPHKGDPQNFILFLQLLDRDAYADVKSIEEAMRRQHAPFYLRRTKEAMVYFPERQPDGAWTAMPVFTKRITHTAGFDVAGAELELYKAISRFVKRQSVSAAAQGDTARARAVGFLMALYQRRLASSARAIRRSLENRARRLEDNLAKAQMRAAAAPPNLPDLEDFEELEEADRICLEELLDAVTLANNAEETRAEIAELREFANQAQAVADDGAEAKLSRLWEILQEQGFFDDPEQRLLIFTEFKDTLDYLVEQLNAWGFQVGQIHGGMRLGSREKPDTRLHVEQQFRDGNIRCWSLRRPPARASTCNAATSCSTTTSPGTRTGWSIAWAAFIATASVTTASSSTSSPPTLLRATCCNGCWPRSRKSGTRWTTTPFSTWWAKSCPRRRWNGYSALTTPVNWAKPIWKTSCCATSTQAASGRSARRRWKGWPPRS